MSSQQQSDASQFEVSIEISFSTLLGLAPTGTWIIASHPSNFNLIRTCFTLGEQDYLIKMFRLFKSKQIFWCSKCEQSSGSGQ
jgi:hypothetical protein